MSRLTNTEENRKGTEPFSYWLKDSHPLEQLKAFKKLADYEDKEEQGLLIEAKCRVGGYVYYPVEDFNVVIPVRINEIVISDLGNGKSCFQYNGITFDGSGDVYEEYEFDDNDFGKTVFLTEVEAEEALAKMKKESI